MVKKKTKIKIKGLLFKQSKVFIGLNNYHFVVTAYLKYNFLYSTCETFGLN